MSTRDHLTLFLCGDLMMGRGIDQVLPHPSRPQLYEEFMTSALDYVALAESVNGPIPRPAEFAFIWGEALAILDQVRPDARIANLETSVTTSEAAVPKGINYRMHPRNAPVLGVAGVDCCTLANNHTLDWGEPGLLETLETVRAAGIATTGAGRDLAEARAPAVLLVDAEGGEAREDGEFRILVYGMGTADSGIPPSWGAAPGRPGIHLLPDLSDRTAAGIGELVRESKRPGDIAVASIHWGGNWGYEIPEAQRRFAHNLVDRAGVDVVHGHSSHHPKGIEVHRDRPIIYGCGDFIHDYEGIRGYETFRNDLVLMYFPTLDRGTGRLLRLEIWPLRIRRFRLTRPTREDRAWLLGVLDRECGRFGHCVVSVGESFALEWGGGRGEARLARPGVVS